MSRVAVTGLYTSRLMATPRSVISSEYQINCAMFEGQWDNLYRGDRREMNKSPQYLAPLADYGVTDSFEFWKWYGDPNNGTGRIYYEGWTGHVLGLASPSYVKAACEFFTGRWAPPRRRWLRRRSPAE